MPVIADDSRDCGRQCSMLPLQVLLLPLLPALAADDLTQQIPSTAGSSGGGSSSHSGATWAVATVASASDLVLGGGAGLQANPLLELRSGSPHTTSTASLSKLLSPGTTVSGLAMAYKYETGYGDKGNASCGVSFSVSVGGKAAYSSPVMTEFPFSRRKDPSAYSPPVSVDARGLGVPITGGGNRKVEFEFTNDCRNVQLLLPLVRQSSRAPARPRPHRCCVPPRVHIRSYIPFRAHTR
jgi:hypothetical protein